MSKEVGGGFLDRIEKIKAVDDEAVKLREKADSERKELYNDFLKEYKLDSYVRHKESGVMGRLFVVGREIAFFPQKKDGSDSIKRATKYEVYCWSGVFIDGDYLTEVLDTYEAVECKGLTLTRAFDSSERQKYEKERKKD